MSAELGMTLTEFQHLLGELDGLEVGSLRVESPWDGKEEDLCEYLPNAPKETPFLLCLRSEMKTLLIRAIAELPEKEQQVLSLYYFEELTMKEVGAVLGIGESRVSQIHSLAVVRLRSRLEEMMSANGQASARGSQRHERLRSDAMQKVLNQEEIDAMVRAARGGTRAEQRREVPSHVEPWDVRRAGQIGREQLQTITTLHESFARNLTHSLGAYLRVVLRRRWYRRNI